MTKSHTIRDLIFHSKNYLSGDIVSKGVGFLALMIYSQLMETSDFGILSISFSLFTLFSVLYGMGIRSALIRYYYEEIEDYNAFISSNILLFLSWSFVLTFILFITGQYISELFRIPELLFYLTIFLGFSMAIFELVQAHFQAKKQSKSYALSQLIKSIVMFVFGLGLTLFLKEDLYYGPIIGMSIAWIIGIVIFIVFKLKKIKISVKKKHIKYTLLFSLPIVFHLLAQNILNTFDQIIINEQLDSKSTGIYSFAYQISVIQLFVILAILKSWTPMYYEYMEKKKYRLINIFISKKSIVIGLISIVSILFVQEIIGLFVPFRYFAAIQLMPILITGYFMFYLYSIYANYSFFLKKTYIVSIITLFAGIINISLNYIYIPKYGITAAAWTTLISYTILFFLNFIVSNAQKSVTVARVTSFIIPGILVIMSLFITISFQFITLNISLVIVIKLIFFALCSFSLLKLNKAAKSINIEQ